MRYNQVSNSPVSRNSFASPAWSYGLGTDYRGCCFLVVGVYGQLQAISATRAFPKEVRLLSALLIGRELPKKWRAKT